MLAVPALLALAVLAVEMLSWNFLKTPIEERFEARTGRSLSIDGDLSLSLFPRPSATVNAVALDNPDWAEPRKLVEIERIRAWPSPWAALAGRLVLDKVAIEALDLNLEGRTRGPANWVLPKLEAASAEHQEQGGAPVLVVRQLSVTDARIRYRAQDQQPLVLSIPSLRIDDDGEATAIQADISFRGRDFDLQANTDSFRKLAGSDGEFDGKLSVHAEQGRFGATFVLAQAPSLQPAHINWELDLRNLADWSRWADLPAIDLQTLSLNAQLDYGAGRLDFADVEAAFAESRVTGELEIVTRGQAPVASARLHSPEFDAAALLAALPDSDKPVDSLTGAIPVLPDMAANIELSVDNLLLDPHHIRSLKAELDLADRVLTVERLGFEVANGSVVANAELGSDPEALALDLDASIRDLELAALNIPPDLAGTVTGEIAFELERLVRQPAQGIPEMLEQLRIEQATASYTNHAMQVDLRATLETPVEPAAPRISVTGDFRNQPIEATVSGDPWSGLAGVPADYALEANVRSGTATVQFETALASILRPQTLAATFDLTADNVRDLQPWLHRALPSMSGVHAAGRLERNVEQWDATELEIEAGESSVSGEVHFRNAERPFVEARLYAARIDPLPWTVASGTSAESGSGDSILAPLRAVDARLDLRVDRLDLPADLDMHQLTVSAALEEGNARIDPLRFDIAEGQVVARMDLDASGQRASGRLEARLGGIVFDRLVETLAPLEDRLGKLSGMVNLDITETGTEDLRDDLMFPFIGRVRVNDSRLRFEDPDAKTDLTLSMRARGPDDGQQEFHVDGQGQYDGDPFVLELRGDKLLRARDPERPYALEIDGEIVETRFGLRGTVLRPLTLEGVALELSLAGPNPQRLGRILGIPFPLLSAYSVTGDLSRDGTRWILRNLDGQVGDSDLAGRLGIDFGARPPHLGARLQSESVRMEDLAGVFGAEPGEDGAASGEPAPTGRFVLPQRPLIEDAWRKVTADVHYRGHALQAGDLPLSNVVINFLLEDGHMRFAPLGFGLGDGSIDFNLDLNVREQPRHGTLEGTMHGVDLREVLHEWSLAGDSLGVIGGRGKFWVEGASIAEMLASADGGLLMLMQGGRLDAILVELAGLDALQTVTSFLRDRDPVPIHCAYIDVKARAGVATFDTFVIDTRDTNFTGGGEIDFATERLDITVVANPRDVSVGVARTPLQMSGTFNDIGLGISAGAVATRLGAAAVLGTLATPVAALIPLLGMGTGEDSGYCEGLVRRSHEAIKAREDPQ